MLSNMIRQSILKAKQYPYILRVGIFGSYARSEQAKASDLDIIIDYDNSSDDFLDNLDDFMEDMEIVYGDKIDYVTFPAPMGSSDERFKQNVLNDVQWVYVANQP